MKVSFEKTILPISLAFTVSVSTSLPAWAGPGDVNSTNDGAVIQGGTYFNTKGSRTTFENSGGDGSLHLRSGDLVRGLESNINGVPTGNGGTLYFRAPNSVIRLDGNIDASAIKNGSVYLGNGGQVFIDAGYLFQNGSIFANGVNGGLIQLNVGAATISSNARITAQGFGGAGGKVAINSPGTVDIHRDAVIDTSGKVVGTVDTNLINIEAGFVNNQGIIRANGVATVDFKANNSDAAILNANPQLASAQPVALQGTERGGTIRLVASGQSMNTQSIVNASTILSASEKSALNNRNTVLAANTGDIHNNGTLQANGFNGQDGGTIILAADDDAANTFLIQANGGAGVNGSNGGNGGTISVNAFDRLINVGLIEANGGAGGNSADVNVTAGNGQDAIAQVMQPGGAGGDGGLIAFSYDTFTQSGTIRANGGVGGKGGNATATDTETAPQNAVSRAFAVAGNGGAGGDGGLIVFSGRVNPDGDGTVQANGGQGGHGGNGHSNAHATTNNNSASVVTGTPQSQGGLGGRAGTVVAPNPGQFTSTQSYSAKAGGRGDTGTRGATWTLTQNGVTTVTNHLGPAVMGSVTTGPDNAIQATRRNELLLHGDTGVLLSQAGGQGNNSTSLRGRFNDAIVRTVENPQGMNVSDKVAATSAVNNLVVASQGQLDLTMDLGATNMVPILNNLNTMTVMNRGNIRNLDTYLPGSQIVGANGIHDIHMSFGGGHLSWMARGNIVNDGILLARGDGSAGSIHLAATGDIVNNVAIKNVAVNEVLLSEFVPEDGFFAEHDGSIILKALRDVVNNGRLNSREAFRDIHPPLDFTQQWIPFMDGAQIGSTIYLLAGRDLVNTQNGLIAADALTYRNGQAGLNSPSNAYGGIVVGRAGRNIINNGQISVDATALQGSAGPKFLTIPPGTVQVQSTDGDIFMN